MTFIKNSNVTELIYQLNQLGFSLWIENNILKYKLYKNINNIEGILKLIKNNKNNIINFLSANKFYEENILNKHYIY